VIAADTARRSGKRYQSDPCHSKFQSHRRNGYADNWSVPGLRLYPPSVHPTRPAVDEHSPVEEDAAACWDNCANRKSARAERAVASYGASVAILVQIDSRLVWEAISYRAADSNNARAKFAVLQRVRTGICFGSSRYNFSKRRQNADPKPSGVWRRQIETIGLFRKSGTICTRIPLACHDCMLAGKISFEPPPFSGAGTTYGLRGQSWDRIGPGPCIVARGYMKPSNSCSRVCRQVPVGQDCS